MCRFFEPLLCDLSFIHEEEEGPGSFRDAGVEHFVVKALDFVFGRPPFRSATERDVDTSVQKLVRHPCELTVV